VLVVQCTYRVGGCRIILVCSFISTVKVLDMQMVSSDCFQARSTKDIYDDEMT
jgi:hypothetical protein